MKGNCNRLSLFFGVFLAKRTDLGVALHAPSDAL